MTMMNLSSHGTQDLYPTFLQRARGLGVTQRSMVTVISMLGAICGGLVMGRWSDRRGRRRVMIWAFIGAILFIPLWALPARLPLLAAGAFALQFMVQGAWGIIPAHICELSPDSIRGFMPGFAYQCGNLVASYITVLEARRAAQWGYAPTLMISAAMIFVLALVVTAAGRERGGITFGEGAANISASFRRPRPSPQRGDGL